MQLEKRVDVLEDKMTQLQIEQAKTKALVDHTVENLAKLSEIVLAEQKMVKMTFSFLGKYYPHILTLLGALVSLGYWAGTHHIIFKVLT